jgi:hypothetical protein
MKSSSRVRTTDAQIDIAIKRARKSNLATTRIVAAHFDRASDSIVVKLSTKATIIVPRAALPGLKAIDPARLVDLSPQASGFSIWSEAADSGLRIEVLLQIAAGPALANIAARILGQTSTVAKASASRANGAKGGRPRKSVAVRSDLPT